jgi:hypothetical protein
MAELLAAFESAVISPTPDAVVASAVRRRLLLIGQLKQLIADNGSTELILEQVRKYVAVDLKKYIFLENACALEN